MITLAGIGGIPGFDDIARLSWVHPVIRYCITLHYRGDITQEECLLLCVQELAAQNTRIKDRLVQVISRSEQILLRL